MHAKLAIRLRVLLIAGYCLYGGLVFGGELPLITDDTSTPGAGVWDLHFGARAEHSSEGTEVEAPFFQVNRGFSDRDELRFEFSVITNDPTDGGSATGVSDLLIGYKYRFLEGKRGWDVSFFPQLTSPTADEDRELGLGQTQLLVPFEFSKHFCCNKAWINYEIGYFFGSGDASDGWKMGMSMGRELARRIELLGEVGTFIYNGDDQPDNPFFNLGFRYPVRSRFKILGSAGRSFRNDDGTPDFFCYFGVEILLGRRAGHGCCCNTGCCDTGCCGDVSGGEWYPSGPEQEIFPGEELPMPEPAPTPAWPRPGEEAP